MYETMYIDVVFVTNLVMDYIILRLTGMLLRCEAGRGRCVLGAAAGTLFFCVILCLPVEGVLRGGCIEERNYHSGLLYFCLCCLYGN